MCAAVDQLDLGTETVPVAARDMDCIEAFLEETSILQEMLHSAHQVTEVSEQQGRLGAGGGGQPTNSRLPARNADTISSASG